MSAPLQDKSPRLTSHSMQSWIDPVMLNATSQNLYVVGFEFNDLSLKSNELMAECYSFTTSLTLTSPQTLSFDHEAQYQYFEFFKNNNASLLSGYFDTDFRGRLVLQLCHQKEFVKHAVVALDSLARNMEVDFDSPLSNNTRNTAPSEYCLFALREYSKFLRLARRNTNKVVESDRLQSILVSCVLTSIYELHQGRQEASIKPVVSGLKIISSVRGQHVLENTHSLWSLGIDIDLLALFIRWEQGFLLFMPSQPPFASHESLQDLEDTLFLENMPVEFSSLKQARLYFDILNRHGLNWYADCNYQCPGERDHPTEVDRLCPNSKPKIYSEDVLAYGAAIDRWSRAFTCIFKSSRSRSRSSSPYQIATALMIKQICVRLGLPQITISEHQITALCAALLEFGVEILEPNNKNQAFKWVDDGLVTGLFLVNQRCPDEKMKSRALELLWNHARRGNLYEHSSGDNSSLEVGPGKESFGRHTMGASQYNHWRLELLEWSVRRRRKHFRPIGEWICAGILYKYNMDTKMIVTRITNRGPNNTIYLRIY
ncbi:hypothetical protein BELL_0007g00170 [Botrytis elliptica]|uniref:Transcription factor domain-containing protein n=1 Tax=Botrytis elliptica TaxID=278938 RepID=A0A4Z1K4H3_9HELO|nr:hypothetical protein BELL_0007g00170 [Botrytis elliptica]